MTEPRQRHWFRAKRYGYGWGLPATWQGWLTLVAFVGVEVGAAAVLSGPARVIVAGAAAVVLILIAFRTGEPPRWRWGLAGSSRRWYRGEVSGW